MDGLRTETEDTAPSKVVFETTGGETLIAGRYGDASRFSDRMSDELDDLRLLCDSGDVIVASPWGTGAPSKCARSASTDPADTSHTDPSWHPAAINSSRREDSACDVGRPRKRVTRVGFERQKLDGPGVSRCTPKPNEVCEVIVCAGRLSRPAVSVGQARVEAHLRCCSSCRASPAAETSSSQGRSIRHTNKGASSSTWLRSL